VENRRVLALRSNLLKSPGPLAKLENTVRFPAVAGYLSVCVWAHVMPFHNPVCACMLLCKCVFASERARTCAPQTLHPKPELNPKE
jgi:hypothetical protein